MSRSAATAYTLADPVPGTRHASVVVKEQDPDRLDALRALLELRAELFPSS
ncbi:MAG: hypothetical protein WCD11_27520 [Solirubrobacteraceae bacterium]